MNQAPAFRHVPQLDGVRAIAVLLVMSSHAGLEGIVPGGFGVTIFFFLSGYLITSLLRMESATTGKLDIEAFYFRRVLRIMPPLYVTLIILTALTPLGLFIRKVDWFAVPWDYLFLSNYSYLWGQSEGLPIPLWSLAVEEHFYLLAPLALAILMRRMPPREIAAVCAVGCLAVLALRLGVAVFLPTSIEHNYYWSHTRLDSIIFGCCLALYQNPLLDEDAWQPKGWQLAAAMIAIVGTFAIRGEVFRETIRYSIQGIGLFVLFSFVLSGRSATLNQFLTWKPLAWIGLVSFSLYLCHVAIYRAVHTLLGVSAPVAGLLGFPLALLYAQAMRVLVELPIMKWRRNHQAAVKSTVRGSAITLDDPPSEPALASHRLSDQERLSTLNNDIHRRLAKAGCSCADEAELSFPGMPPAIPRSEQSS